MKITYSFEVYDKILYSLQFEGDEKHAWKQFYENWGDPQYVSEFLHYYQHDLRNSLWKNQRMEDLIKKTVRNVRWMQRNILDAAKNQVSGKDLLD